MFTNLIDFLCRCSGIRGTPCGWPRAAASGQHAGAAAPDRWRVLHRCRRIRGLPRLHHEQPVVGGRGRLRAALGGLIFALDRSLALSFDPGAAPWSGRRAAAVRLALAAVVPMPSRRR